MLTVKRKNNGATGFFSPFDELFGNVFPAGFAGVSREFVPSVNVRETEKAYVVELQAPGFEKKNLSIDFEGDYFSISGSTEESKEQKEEKFTRREFFSGSFKRTFSVPEDADADKADAAYENGILRITLPKREITNEASAKKIEIR